MNGLKREMKLSGLVIRCIKLRDEFKYYITLIDMFSYFLN